MVSLTHCAATRKKGGGREILGNRYRGSFQQIPTECHQPHRMSSTLGLRDPIQTSLTGRAPCSPNVPCGSTPLTSPRFQHQRCLFLLLTWNSRSDTLSQPDIMAFFRDLRGSFIRGQQQHAMPLLFPCLFMRHGPPAAILHPVIPLLTNNLITQARQGKARQGKAR